MLKGESATKKVIWTILFLMVVTALSSGTFATARVSLSELERVPAAISGVRGERAAFG
jgi:hypothetical protein